MTCGQLEKPPTEPVAGARPARQSRGLSKTAVNFLVDMGCLLFLLCTLLASAIVQFVFPRGTAAVGWTLWGLGYDAWCVIQFVCLSAFTLMILIHLILHWTWICAFVVTRVGKKSGRDAKLSDGVKTLWGVSFLVAVLTLLGALLAAAYFSVVPGQPIG